MNVEAPRWISVKEALPDAHEVVRVHQLCWPWACYVGGRWFAIDYCGNKSYIAWQPEYWGREIHVLLPDQPPYEGAA